MCYTSQFRSLELRSDDSDVWNFFPGKDASCTITGRDLSVLLFGVIYGLEKKMEATIMGIYTYIYIYVYVFVEGILYSLLGLYRDNGKEHGNYHSILGLYRDTGKDHGNYYSISGLYRKIVFPLLHTDLIAGFCQKGCGSIYPQPVSFFCSRL